MSKRVGGLDRDQISRAEILGDPISPLSSGAQLTDQSATLRVASYQMDFEWTRSVREMLSEKSELFEFSPVLVASGRGVAVKRNDKFRRSLRLSSKHFPELARQVESLLRNRKKEIVELLNLPASPWHHFQIQGLAYGDGDYFELHRDTSPFMERERLVTFVCFVHREPAAFQGGDLELVGGKGASLRLTPRVGQLVLFPSRTLHRVHPVQLLGDSFIDRRLVLSGFISRERGWQERLFRFCRSTAVSLRRRALRVLRKMSVRVPSS